MYPALALAALSLPACIDAAAPGGVQIGFCYQDETCSPDTPYGLQFIGVDPTLDDGHPNWPGAIALGGSETITLRRYTDDLQEQTEAFTLPYVADDGGHAGVAVVAAQEGQVKVRAIANASNMLRIVAPDGKLYDRWPLIGEPIDRVQVRPPATEWWGPARSDGVVWLPGDHDLVVALWGTPYQFGNDDSDRLYDETVRLAMPGAESTAWDTLHATGMTVGHQAIAITGDSGNRMVDVETVAAPDQLVVTGDDSYIEYDIPNSICFQARNFGRFVADVQWSFEATGAQITTDDVLDTPHSGCAYYWPDARTGTFTIHAHASGFSQDITVPIAP